MRYYHWFVILFFNLLSTLIHATPNNTQLAVWANEAIIATYNYDYKNYLTQQKAIAQYFTAPGWIAYSTALNASKLPQDVQKNAYYVSAVATYPPTIKNVGPQQWQATMPILVIYKNPQYQQKQTLNVTINFQTAAKGQGIRSLAITSLHSQVSQPPCQCLGDKEKENTATGNSV